MAVTADFATGSHVSPSSDVRNAPRHVLTIIARRENTTSTAYTFPFQGTATGVQVAHRSRDRNRPTSMTK